MSDSTKKKIRLISAILLSVMLIVTGVLLMVACVNIYNIGTRPFTIPNISAEFSKISAFVWITVGCILVCGVLSLVFPEENKRPRALIEKKVTLARLLRRVNLDATCEETRAKFAAEKKLCKYLRIATILLCVAAAIPAVIYLLDFSHFGEDYNQSVIMACAWILPCTFVSMGIYLIYNHLQNASIERQITLAKAAMAESKNFTTPVAKEIKEDNKIVNIIRIAIAVIAVAFLIAGIVNGGMADVLSKAINICTECIGLG